MQCHLFILFYAALLFSPAGLQPAPKLQARQWLAAVHVLVSAFGII